ncbi:DUF4344 domain-containing metallopeptidase [Embleya sp. NPDC005575]|uniref:DUF4344 domain-containing metallopeptidase n=1 Tax=Embleya sp. NPDC005575 TaxID=3156892 RepID=UPI0033BEA6AA
MKFFRLDSSIRIEDSVSRTLADLAETNGPTGGAWVGGATADRRLRPASLGLLAAVLCPSTPKAARDAAARTVSVPVPAPVRLRGSGRDRRRRREAPVAGRISGMWIRVASGRGIGAGRMCAGLLAMALLGGCGGASDDDGRDREARPTPTGSPGSAGFEVSYEPPADADRAEAGFLRDRKALESVADALDRFVRLTHRVPVVARSCGGEGSGYDPNSRRVEICYDQAAEERRLFERAGRHPADAEVAAVMVETLYHEAGHVLIDELALQLADRAEEDAADRFAALLMLRQGPEGERQLLAAVEEYELSAADGDTDGDRGTGSESGDGGGSGGARDEHAPDRLRAANHLCYLYGSAPDRNPEAATSPLLTPARAAGCATEWTHVRAAWMTDLAPLLRER